MNPECSLHGVARLFESLTATDSYDLLLRHALRLEILDPRRREQHRRTGPFCDRRRIQKMVAMRVAHQDHIRLGDIRFLDAKRLPEWRSRVVVVCIKKKHLPAIVHLIVSTTEIPQHQDVRALR